ncbi:F-box/WD repeat-containing protein lin-23 [Drosophila bipectinata]|uniref:F-box/WD repeat-containing protein lin-23 n=1 Tax=Drosophila bipectinata TaxID=42026 RepID=UPI001C89236A|nr:E3 ubiquitin-protein ligase TRAF7 [Drosophila bipectinata]
MVRMGCPQFAPIRPMANNARIEHTSTEGHEGDATCVAYFGGQLFSGGADGKIRIWSPQLELISTVNAHESYIYCMAVNQHGKIYSSSCDGQVHFMLPPYEDSAVQELFRCDDAIQAMYCDGSVLYTGDDKGVVTTWSNDRMLFKYSLVEEVKSLAGEQKLIYTVRDLDVVVSLVVEGKSGKYSNKAVLPGKSPLLLLGPLVEGKRSFLAFPDRSGMGLQLVNNLPQQQFAHIWHLPNCHEWIVNAICGDEKYLYSGGYDKKLKGWTDLDATQPRSLGEVDVGSCVNSVCCGENNMVYIASSDGFIRAAKFI